MKSYISRKFPLETRTTDQTFAFRSAEKLIGFVGSLLQPWQRRSIAISIRAPLPPLVLLGGFEELGSRWCFLLHLIANLLRLLLELGFFALLVVENNADGPDRLAGLVLHNQFHLEMVAFLVDLKIRFAGLDHSQIILVRFLPDASNVGRDDHVLILPRRRDVHGHNHNLFMFGQRLIQKFLRINLLCLLSRSAESAS